MAILRQVKLPAPPLSICSLHMPESSASASASTSSAAGREGTPAADGAGGRDCLLVGTRSGAVYNYDFDDLSEC